MLQQTISTFNSSVISSKPSNSCQLKFRLQAAMGLLSMKMVRLRPIKHMLEAALFFVFLNM